MRNRVPFLVLIIAGIAGYLIYLLLRDSNRGIWIERYHPDKETPYDLDAFKRYLTAERPSLRMLETSMMEGMDTSGTLNYLFIGNYPFYNPNEIELLQRQVAAGGEVFIAATELPEAFYRAFLSMPNDTASTWEKLTETRRADTVHLHLVNDYLLKDTVPIYYQSQYGLEKNNWRFFNSYRLFIQDHSAREGLAIQRLGMLNGYDVNFVRLLYGKGKVYLYLTPLIFTNFHIRQAKDRALVGALLAYVPNNRPLIWDVYSQYWHTDDFDDSPHTGHAPSPFQFILGEPSLRAAWYMAWGFLLLFLVFSARRKIKAIPVIPPKRNTALEFAHTIGQLYFQKGNPGNLVLKKFKLLQWRVQQSTGLVWHENNAQALERLAAKTGLDQRMLSDLESEIRRIRTTGDCTRKEMQQLYQIIQSIYKKLPTP